MNHLLTLVRNQWDRTAAAILVVAGLVALLAGWIGVTDTIFTSQQIPYVISGGLLGVCLVALGGTLWLSADLRDEWRALDRLADAAGTANTREVLIRESTGSDSEGRTAKTDSARRMGVAAER